jgi:hypothetical protein
MEKLNKFTLNRYKNGTSLSPNNKNEVDAIVASAVTNTRKGTTLPNMEYRLRELKKGGLKKKPTLKKKSTKKKSTKKKSTKKLKKKLKKSTTKKKSIPKKHKGPRGGVYIIRKGRKIYQ